MVHPPHETPQGSSVAEPETLLMIIPGLISKSDEMLVHDDLSNPFF